MCNYSLFGFVNLSKYPRSQREAMSFQYEIWFKVTTFPFLSSFLVRRILYFFPFSSFLVRRMLSVFLLRCVLTYIYFLPTLLFLSFLYVVQSGLFFLHVHVNNWRNLRSNNEDKKTSEYNVLLELVLIKAIGALR